MKSKRKAAALLREYIRGLLREGGNVKRLRVFDFDDTLVVTDARVWVTPVDGERFALTPGEFAVYEKRPDDVMDYSEFQQLINPRAIAWTGRILRNVYDKYGPEGLVILSARSTPEPIQQFLRDAGMPGVEVRALNNADPKAKAAWVDTWIREKNLDYVEFFDDSHKNIAAVKQLKHDHPDVHIVVRHVVHTHLPTHGFSKHYGTRRAPRPAE
jgi:hypothetical protein